LPDESRKSFIKPIARAGGVILCGIALNSFQTWCGSAAAGLTIITTLRNGDCNQPLSAKTGTGAYFWSRQQAENINNIVILTQRIEFQKELRRASQHHSYA
jgi:hypothetical protein